MSRGGNVRGCQLRPSAYDTRLQVGLWPEEGVRVRVSAQESARSEMGPAGGLGPLVKNALTPSAAPLSPSGLVESAFESPREELPLALALALAKESLGVGR